MDARGFFEIKTRNLKIEIRNKSENQNGENQKRRWYARF
jgi:hypothetical protein